jgi:hypothetical protein
MSRDIELRLEGRAFLGTRYLGRELRMRLERLLDTPGDVRIRFGQIGVTQSFLDEFIGVLVVRYGQTLVDRLVFVGCSRDAEALLELVIGARLEDHEHLSAKARYAAQKHPRPRTTLISAE